MENLLLSTFFCFACKRSHIATSIPSFKIVLLPRSNGGLKLYLETILRRAPQAPNSYFCFKDEGSEGKSGEIISKSLSYVKKTLCLVKSAHFRQTEEQNKLNEPQKAKNKHLCNKKLRISTSFELVASFFTSMQARTI